MTRKILILLSIFSILTNCKKIEKPKIERFVWIQNNVIWIWQPSDLKARYYLEYTDSSKMINFAHSIIVRDNNKIVTERTDYYKSKAPKELEEMIYRFLLNKKYSQSYRDSLKPKSIVVYDADCYCIIYKFKNQPERIITYRPHTITDSLKTFVEQLETYKKLNSFEPQKPFDTEYFIVKYKKIIVEGIPLAPPPCTDTAAMARVKYKVPLEIDTNKEK